MTNDVMLGGVYLLMAMMLVLGSLMQRREKPAKLLVIALAWIAIFGGGFILFTFRDNLGWVAQRLRAEATGEPVVVGNTVRIPMAIDGHFWVDAEVNGRPVKFLVDSGATTTTVGRQTARKTGLEVGPTADQMVRTGNGIVKMFSGRAQSISVGSIDRQDMAIQVADNDDLNVLGMNYLSSLSRWGVEGRWLVLVS